MRYIVILTSTFSWLLSYPMPAQGAEDYAVTASLVGQLQDSSSDAVSGASFVTLRQKLTVASPETAVAMQASLCQALRTATDAQTIRRISLVLSAAPCEDAIVVLAGRLDTESTEPMREALCRGISVFGDRRPTLSPATITFATQRLDSVARDPRSRSRLVESAIMATAALGGAGFDQLMKLKDDPKSSGRIREIIYTALSQTDDPRALKVLRNAVADGSTSDGKRSQAMNGLGMMFGRATSAGRSIDSLERQACVNLLKTYLNDAMPDQVFGASLLALSRMVSVEQDFEYRQAVLVGLRAYSAARREAALDALGQHKGVLDLEISALVREIQEMDSSPDLRSAATSVVGIDEPLQPAPSSDLVK